jgi:NAD(P)-dependent dehydrogenase (short-subunit alcohol dehydrogenase family)
MIYTIVRAGIGLEFVKQCSAKGAAVVATYRGSSPPATLTGLGPLVSTVPMDVSDPDSVSAAASELKQRPDFHGFTHIIHSAGIFGSYGVDLMKITKQMMMDVFATNTVGVVLVAQSFVPLMTRTIDGKLPIFACISSKVGSVDDNSGGRGYAYRASKSAVNNVCKSLSIDLQGTCAVCLLHPGFVQTDLTNGQGSIDVHESVSGMLGAVESTDKDTPFRWVDFAKRLIPW